eukprot:scaffold72569_cov23-Prasinocladus_malaysianus.AAC.1
MQQASMIGKKDYYRPLATTAGRHGHIPSLCGHEAHHREDDRRTDSIADDRSAKGRPGGVCGPAGGYLSIYPLAFCQNDDETGARYPVAT